MHVISDLEDRLEALQTVPGVHPAGPQIVLVVLPVGRQTAPGVFQTVLTAELQIGLQFMKVLNTHIETHTWKSGQNQTDLQNCHVADSHFLMLRIGRHNALQAAQQWFACCQLDSLLEAFTFYTGLPC